MKTSPRSCCEYIADNAARSPLSEQAAIVSEIAERMIELEDVKLGMAADIIQRLAQLYVATPDGFRATLELLRGNTGATTESFGHRAGGTALLKQTWYYRWKTSVKLAGKAFPELAAALTESRAHVHRHFDGMSLGDAITSHNLADDRN
jgi:hypothetical protein